MTIEGLDGRPERLRQEVQTRDIDAEPGAGYLVVASTTDLAGPSSTNRTPLPCADASRIR
jgi:hypothetical protein